MSVEIHIGRFGKLILSPEDIDYKNYPKIKNTFIPINDINLSLPSVSIEGKIIRKSQLNTLPQIQSFPFFGRSHAQRKFPRFPGNRGFYHPNG